MLAGQLGFAVLAAAAPLGSRTGPTALSDQPSSALASAACAHLPPPLPPPSACLPAAYHHGEASLSGTIVGLAQDFVGSNNVNYLVPQGEQGWC